MKDRYSAKQCTSRAIYVTTLMCLTALFCLCFSGSVLAVTEADYSGPKARQRVSLHKLDPDKSTLNEPYHTFDESQKLLPNEIVPG